MIRARVVKQVEQEVSMVDILAAYREYDKWNVAVESLKRQLQQAKEELHLAETGLFGVLAKASGKSLDLENDTE